MKNKIIKVILSTIHVINTCNMIMFLISIILGTINQSYIIFTGCLNSAYVLLIILLSRKVDIVKMFNIKPRFSMINIKTKLLITKRR